MALSTNLGVLSGSATYSLAHTLASLTVTNRELRALALAEKDMTLEQYETLKDLQRVKAKDEDGNVVGDAPVGNILCVDRMKSCA